MLNFFQPISSVTEIQKQPDEGLFDQHPNVLLTAKNGKFFGIGFEHRMFSIPTRPSCEIVMDTDRRYKVLDAENTPVLSMICFVASWALSALILYFTAWGFVAFVGYAFCAKVYSDREYRNSLVQSGEDATALKMRLQVAKKDVKVFDTWRQQRFVDEKLQEDATRLQHLIQWGLIHQETNQLQGQKSTVWFLGYLHTLNQFANRCGDLECDSLELGEQNFQDQDLNTQINGLNGKRLPENLVTTLNCIIEYLDAQENDLDFDLVRKLTEEGSFEPAIFLWNSLHSKESMPDTESMQGSLQHLMTQVFAGNRVSLSHYKKFSSCVNLLQKDVRKIEKCLKHPRGLPMLDSSKGSQLLGLYQVHPVGSKSIELRKVAKAFEETKYLISTLFQLVSCEKINVFKETHRTMLKNIIDHMRGQEQTDELTALGNSICKRIREDGLAAQGYERYAV